MTDVRDAALWWAGQGFCVLPTNQNAKTPMISTWKQYNRKKGETKKLAAPAVQIVDTWFTAPQTGLGLILGGVSGEAEMFEFEGRAIEEIGLASFGAMCETNGAGEIWARLKRGYVELTPSGGLHLVFKVVGGLALPSTKLASRPSSESELARNPDQPIQVLIETRGEGGFVVVAPSGVTSDGEKQWAHIPAGQPGRWAQTSFGEIVTLTVDERDHLYAVARMFNSVPEYVRKEVVAREKVDGQVSPLDDFRARTDWADILEPEGWTYVGSKTDGRDAWLRPGKDTTEGWALSATTGNTDGKSDSLYIFSTSTDLPVGTGLSKEFVWAHYNAGGDLREAARSLREQGYGSGGEVVSRVVAGDTNPFSDGFDPAAWAERKAATNAAARVAGAVPTVGPINPFASDLRADEAGGEVSSAGSTETDHVESEFKALNWPALYAEEYVQEWIVDGLLPRAGTVALYSASGVGKSLFALELAANVARGTPFLGMATTKTVVLYVDHENGPRSTIVPRLKAMGFTSEQLVNLKVLSFPTMATLDSEAGGLAIVRAIAQFDAGLVVIDTVSRTIQGEENSNDTWLAFFRHTGKLLKDAEIAYIRLDHSGKDEAKGQRGGSAKTGDVEIILQLTRIGSGRFSLRHEKDRDQVLPVAGFVFNRLNSPLRSEIGVNAAPTGDQTFDQYVKAVTLFVGKLQREYDVPGTEKTMAQLKALWGSKAGDAATAAEYVDRLVKHGWLLLVQPDAKSLYVKGPNFGDPDVPAATASGFIQVL